MRKFKHDIPFQKVLITVIIEGENQTHIQRMTCDSSRKNPHKLV